MEEQSGDAEGGRADSRGVREAVGRGLKVLVDGRALDTEHLRRQGIGRYAHGLLGELPNVAEERDGRLTVLRRRGSHRGAFADHGTAPTEQLFARRPPVPRRAAELVDQGLLPLDAWRSGAAVHHSLSLYGTPLVARAPVVVTMHDVVPLQWPDRYLRTGLVHRALYRAVRRAAAIICPSGAVSRDVLTHLQLDPERLHVIPEGAEGHFRPTEASEIRARLGLSGPYLLYVGGLEHDDPRKDVAGLLDAFARWRGEESRPETLVLAGTLGPFGRQLERRAASLGAPLVAPGFVADRDLPALYSGASCFVTASRYEGFGLPLLESIACGTPVVAYETSAIPETAGPGALLAAPGDGRELMRAVGRVCDDPALAERLSADGRAHAAGFSWRRSAELTWQVYERAAA